MSSLTLQAPLTFRANRCAPSVTLIWFPCTLLSPHLKGRTSLYLPQPWPALPCSLTYHFPTKTNSGRQEIPRLFLHTRLQEYQADIHRDWPVTEPSLSRLVAGRRRTLAVKGLPLYSCLPACYVCGACSCLFLHL
ncbi:hypothetical protein E2C01_082965 [Portunus trituberculatus]|uniref:Uncharacterized protein n=1 Tax=Portunus trituberculatus TaxID=210409 RepID=A0A5B7IZW1_PORTR|nr:hypothetical protein [Portunus trituberculatus]